LTTSLLGAHTAGVDPDDAPPTSATHALPPFAGRANGSGPRRTSPLAVFIAAGFDSRSRSWLAAISFYEREGHLWPPRGHRELNTDVYSAIAQVRIRYRARKLTPAQIAAWESIGMIWAPRTALTKKQRAEIVRLCNSDDPMPPLLVLAKQFSCSPGMIHRFLTAAHSTAARELSDDLPIVVGLGRRALDDPAAAGDARAPEPRQYAPDRATSRLALVDGPRS